jgi:acetyl-CoA carboxylase carboxyltransferase component
MGVMEGDSAVMALFGAQLEKLKKEGRAPDPELEAKLEAVRAEYETQLDAKYAAARGFSDAVIAPEETRAAIGLALRTATQNPGAHLGAFVLPAGV